MDVKINAKDFNRILSVVGYPAIPEDLLEFSPQDIKNLFVMEAMEDYFSRFPLIKEETHSVSGTFQIPYPAEPAESYRETIGVADARILKRTTTSGVTGNPFHDMHLLSTYGTGGTSGYMDVKGHTSFRGPSADVLGANINDNLVATAMQNYTSGSRIKVLTLGDLVTGNTSITGDLMISWGQSSLDFNDVPRKHRKEVIWLSQAILLKRLAMLRSQSNTGQGVDFNISELMKESEKLERQVRDKWKERKAVVLLRA